MSGQRSQRSGIAYLIPSSLWIALVAAGQGGLQQHGLAAGETSLAEAQRSAGSPLTDHLCAFVPVMPSPTADELEVKEIVAMVWAVWRTWAGNRTTFLLPPVNEQPIGLQHALAGLPLEILPASAAADGLRGLRVWRHILSIAAGATGCAWSIKAPLWSFVNLRALAARLSCFDSSIPWLLGAAVDAYSAGEDPFTFPDHRFGTILSRGAYEVVQPWLMICLAQLVATMPLPPGPPEFLEDYTFASCLADLGHMRTENFADLSSSFIKFDQPDRTMKEFALHPDTVKQCLFGVGTLAGPEDLEHVHGRISWSEWHKSIPCLGESQLGSHFKMVDALGNTRPYFDERIRLAIHHCKAPEMQRLEQELTAKLKGKNPREGRGALPNTTASTVASLGPKPRRHLCIFVPASARQPKFIAAAQAARTHWATNTTFFVARSGLSPALDRHRLALDIDLDTDYAHLPVRTFRLFEALGGPEWEDECDWYMKADADSFVNVPLVRKRLKCFDPNLIWFLGVPQVAQGAKGKLTPFASGGAGYIVSRALLPRLATWAPFCLLQVLSSSGGTGMEDVLLAECLWKWGHVPVTSYIDREHEAIDTEAALKRTRVKEVLTLKEVKALMPACTFVVHSVPPKELRIAAKNVRTAWRAATVQAQACKPDPSRVTALANSILIPEGRADHQLTVYRERDVAALLRCSRGE